MIVVCIDAVGERGRRFVEGFAFALMLDAPGVPFAPFRMHIVRANGPANGFALRFTLGYSFDYTFGYALSYALSFALGLGYVPGPGLFPSHGGGVAVPSSTSIYLPTIRLQGA